MEAYHERKMDRIRRFEAMKGVKMVTCGACSGSGYYDHNGSPPCGNCSGRGKVFADNKAVQVAMVKGRYIISEAPEPTNNPSWRQELANRSPSRTQIRKGLRR